MKTVQEILKLYFFFSGNIGVGRKTHFWYESEQKIALDNGDGYENT